MNPQALLEENTSLRHQVTLQGDQIKLLQEQLDWFKRQLFGKRSEKIIDNPNQLSLELELEQITQELKEQTIAAHKRRKNLSPNRTTPSKNRRGDQSQARP